MNPRELPTAPVAPQACSSSHRGTLLDNAWSRCAGLIAPLAGHVRLCTEPREMLGVGEVVIQTWRMFHAVRGRTHIHWTVCLGCAPKLIHGDGHLRETGSARESWPRALQMRITVCRADGERSLTPRTIPSNRCSSLLVGRLRHMREIFVQVPYADLSYATHMRAYRAEQIMNAGCRTTS